MNFFGHATVATWHTDRPAMVLGAMLPDFASMVRSPLERVAHPELASGVALHHATDEAFHGAPTFVRLCKTAVGELDAAGLSRGSARAIAHVGVELFLDGWLVRHGGATGAYLEALEAARETRLGARITWKHPEASERFVRLRERLLALGFPDDLDRAESVAERLLVALASRPRLRVDDEGAATLKRSLPAMRARVLASAEALLDEVRARLPQAPERTISSRIPEGAA